MLILKYNQSSISTKEIICQHRGIRIPLPKVGVFLGKLCAPHHLPTLISAFLAGEENWQKMFPPPHRNLFLLALTSKSSARMMEMLLSLEEYQTFCEPKSVGASQHPDEGVFNFGPQILGMSASSEALLDHIRSPSDAFIRRNYLGINTSVIEEKNTNMASADDSSGIPLLSAPVPPRGNDGQRYRDGLPQHFVHQNCPPTAAATVKHRHDASTMRCVFK